MIENPIVTASTEPERYPICPACGTECETIYISDDGKALGCEYCVNKKDSWDWMADEKEAEQDERDDRKYQEFRDEEIV